MAALAPMPSASVTTTVAAIPLARSSERKPTRMSCAERLGRVEPAAVPDAAHRIAHGGDVAELAQRREARRLRILAALDPLLDAEREVAADFVVEFAIVGTHR